MTAEALTFATDITRMTVEGLALGGGAVAIPETNLTASSGKATWQNVNVTPGSYSFVFRAYKQTAGSGTFTVTGTVAAADTVTVTQGANSVTFTARESLQAPPSPWTTFNIGGAGAWGMVTLAGVTAGDTFLINGVVFTAIAIAPVAGSQTFQVGADDTATAVNLTAAVNGCTTTGAGLGTCLSTTLPHSSGIRNYVTATQVGAASIRFQMAPGLTGNSVTMASTVGATHFTYDPIANHPSNIQSNLTAGNLAAVITTNATTAKFVSTSVAGNIVTVAAKATGALSTPITLASSNATNIPFTAFGSGGDLLIGTTTVTPVAVAANLTTVLNVTILDTTTRDATTPESGPVINAFSSLPVLNFTAAPANWAGGIPYVVGDIRTSPLNCTSATCNVYMVSTAGTSGAASATYSGPTGSCGSNVSASASGACNGTPPYYLDGTVRWRLISGSPNAWSSLTFSATVASVAADSFNWSVTSTCPSGKGKLATTQIGNTNVPTSNGWPYAAAISGSVVGAVFPAQTYWFVDSVLETCTIKIQVDKVRNIGAGASTAAWTTGTAYAAGAFVNSGGNLYVCTNCNGVLTAGATAPNGLGRAFSDGTLTWDYAAGLPVVIGSDYKTFQITTAPIVGQGGVVANVSYVQNPLILEALVKSKEGTCAIGAGLCDPTVAYEGGVGPGECSRFNAPTATPTFWSTAALAPTPLTPWTGRCDINKAGCIAELPIPAAWANNTAYTVGQQVVNGGIIYSCSTAGTSAVTPATGPSTAANPMGLAIADGTAAWNYVSYALAPWAGNTAYTVGNRVVSLGNIYRCTTAGTSALVNGPTGTLAVINDGTVVWAYETPASGCATLTYPDGSSHPQSCIAGVQNGHCKFDNTRCNTTPSLWTTPTAYLVGSRVLNCTAAGVCNIYVATVAGTSGAAPGPVGVGTGIADGTVIWNWSTPSTGCLDYSPAGAAVATPWAAATAYVVGQFVSYLGNVFICTSAGNSGAAAPTNFTAYPLPASISETAPGTAKWAPYSTLVAWNASHNPAAQTCIADSFEDTCVPESLTCGFTDPLNPIDPQTVNACTTGRKAGSQLVQMSYTLGAPIANVAPYLDVIACEYLDGSTVPLALMPTTALLSTTNSLATFNAVLNAPTAWAASTAYAVGARVANNGYIYVATAAGTSAASGGPAGTGAGIVDGTVTWNYASNASYWCKFNARVVQTVQSTPALSGGAGTLTDEQQIQVYVTP